MTIDKKINLLYLKNIYNKLGYKFIIDNKNKIGKFYFKEESTKEDFIVSLNNCYGDISTTTEIIKNIENLKLATNQIKIIFLKGFDSTINSFGFINIILHDIEYIENIELCAENNFNYIELSPFNEKVSNDKTKELLKNRKIPLVQATGTGKTNLCFSIIYKIPGITKVLYVAPSIYVLDGVAETTHPKNIEIKYMTYSKVMHNLKSIKNEYFDLIVLDEFHRCGASEWGISIKSLLDNNNYKYIIGLTATPIRNLDNNRNMAYEIFEDDGENILPISKAISYNIVPSPIFYSGFYSTSNMYENYKKNIEKLKINNKELLKRVNEAQKKSDILIKEKLKIFISKYNTNGKFIVFCKDLNHIYENKDMVVSWFKSSGLKNIKSFIVHTDIKGSDNKLNEFKNTEENALIFCVNKLSEGVNLELSGIIMLRDTKSSIVYFQQIGRCLRANFKNRPIIMDLVNNSDNIFVQKFKAEVTREYLLMNAERERCGLSKINIKKDMFLEDTKDIINLFKSIEHNVYKTWEEAFDELKRFYDINGHSTYPVSIDNKKTIMGTWCSKNRTLYKNGMLSQERIDKLNSIEFTWNTYENKWKVAVEKYKKELQENNLSKQSLNFIENCRRQLSQGKLSEERKQILLSIGADVKLKRKRKMFDYNKAIKELQNYIDKNNNIPGKNYSSNDIGIGNWARNIKNRQDKDELVKKINRDTFTKFIYK